MRLVRREGYDARAEAHLGGEAHRSRAQGRDGANGESNRMVHEVFLYGPINTPGFNTPPGSNSRFAAARTRANAPGRSRSYCGR